MLQLHLEDVWRDAGLFKLLKTFAATKYSEENILFLEAVGDFLGISSIFHPDFHLFTALHPLLHLLSPAIPHCRS